MVIRTGEWFTHWDLLTADRVERWQSPSHASNKKGISTGQYYWYGFQLMTGGEVQLCRSGPQRYRSPQHCRATSGHIATISIWLITAKTTVRQSWNHRFTILKPFGFSGFEPRTWRQCHGRPKCRHRSLDPDPATWRARPMERWAWPLQLFIERLVPETIKKLVLVSPKNISYVGSYIYLCFKKPDRFSGCWGHHAITTRWLHVATGNH